MFNRSSLLELGEKEKEKNKLFLRKKPENKYQEGISIIKLVLIITKILYF